ncbi:MAG: hypothetical protein JNL83_27145 [Myxococcales bacterium]|nr:hypothetical protein [Myxococcales bacterium]
MPRLPIALAAVGALGAGLTACSDESYLVVTVTGRPAVHDVSNLKVTLSNAGTMRTDDLALGSATFPVTFSISAPGRSGDLGVSVDAVDQDGLLVGRGETTTTVDATTAAVTLDTADFVINTEYADNQFPSDDYEAHGFQVSSGSDGTWTTAYRDRCMAPCNMFARRFDRTGKAVVTKIAAGTNGFPISTNLTTSLSTPAIATAGMNTMEVWDFSDPNMAGTVGVACRSIDATGMGIPDERVIATDPSTDVVSVAPLANGNFAVAWNAFITTSVIRTAIVRPDCTVLAGPLTVSTTASARKATVTSVGTTPGTVLYAFVIDGGVRVRLANFTGGFINPTSAGDVQFVPKTATEVVESVRVAPLGTGFAIVVRWALATGTTGPGRIDLYRTNNMGAVIGQAIPVTTRSGSDFQSSEAFGVATRASDNTLLVVWHSCLTNGDGSGCGVYGRAFRENGTPAGEEFLIPTTTTGDQTNPSATALDDSFAVVWKDDSGQAPDVAGSSVRGRIIYPPGATP